LNELRERIHNAKVLNDRAVLQEEKLNIDAKFNEKFKNQTIQSLKEKEKKELEFK
jgi:peptidyl-prolyl isomerase G (cyclophilin G)